PPLFRSRPPAPSEDSLRPFFDSLRTSRDTLLPPGTDTARVPFTYDTSRAGLRADSAARLRWVELLADSVLRHLVDTALEANRDVRTARAVIDEFRAQYRATRGALLPDLSANGTGGRNEVQFGTFGAQTFNGYKATADARDRKSTRLNSSHVAISYAVICLKKNKGLHTTRKTSIM